MYYPDAVLEVAIFTVKAEFESQMPALRAGLREVLKAFPGLIQYGAYCPISNDRVFADLAVWDSLESARRVADAFNAGDMRFALYMQAIEQLTFMSHFALEPQEGRRD
mgnify:FL=1